jgi:uncharacterized membrane protein YkvA (DUF1232 family)
MLRNPATPMISKVIAIAALLYLLSPADFVSDLVPVLGWVDDAMVLAGLLWFAYRFLPSGLYQALRRRSGGRARDAIDGQAERVV